MDDPKHRKNQNDDLFVFFVSGQEASSEEVPEVYLEFWHR